MKAAGEQAQTVRFTAAAVQRTRQLIEAEGNPDLKLRVAVSGGGCSGFQYGFSLEAGQEADDLVLEREGVRLLVDPLSLEYLEGAEIDFSEDLSGAQFVIRNPAARNTCTCGASFAV